ncbi:protein-disulfide reductase DsbD domain-containing protein [Oceanimonas smirnovii]|uniref:Protein-disulfide reductase DsbD domain-containing protein n=1 Tax=Oceanimonas smirnovii TaxID=264574 RepID=A0ABW7P177_9GAMM
MKPTLLMVALAVLTLMLAPFALEQRSASAPAGNQVMPVEQAFVITHERTDRVLQLNIDIAPGAYLYRDKLQLTAENLALGKWQLPAGEAYEDEYFGKSHVFREPLTLVLPLQHLTRASRLTLSYQGCGNGLCYPPQLLILELD